ncbi:MAG TPA: hypothetical protein VJX47_07245 [Candidatus Sulfotelmatobacter sp.]|nr:hypothetical protein [Candidatus Sulfotelmatobacter sp.]
MTANLERFKREDKLLGKVPSLSRGKIETVASVRRAPNTSATPFGDI